MVLSAPAPFVHYSAFTENLSLGVTILGYHPIRTVAPPYLRDALKPGHTYGDGTATAIGHTGAHASLGDTTRRP